MMEQYQTLKREAGDAVLFLRCGDFYEMFFEDAELGSRALGIALTSRAKDGDRIPMAGVPVRAVDNYLARMVRQGYRVALCDQVEDPTEAKGLVRREIVRVVTPGTLTEETVLSARDHNFLVALRLEGEIAGTSWVDLSTGIFQAEDFPAVQLPHHLARLEPGEILVGEDSAERDAALLSRLSGEFGATVTRRADWIFRPDRGREKLLAHLRTRSLAGFGCEGLGPALGAAGALLEYLEETQKTELAHIRRISRYPTARRMILDRATVAALELVRTLREGERKGTVLAVLDRTVTPMGARLLKDWLLAPLTDLDEIRRRHDAVAELVTSGEKRQIIRRSLQPVHDLERIAAKVSCGRASPRDLASLARSLAPLPALREGVLSGAASEALVQTAGCVDPLEELAAHLARALADEVPPVASEGGIFRAGWNAELDELRGLLTDGRQWLAGYQAREAARTGIDSLKVGYNNVFGYYIEVTHTHREKIPADFVRKQTLKNAERYITPELKEYESKVLTAGDRAKKLERELFEELRRRVATDIERLLASTDACAHLDAFASLAETAVESRYVRPEMDPSRALSIRGGRHPVLERSEAGSFVPNDLDLSDERFVVVLTGPNMAGKSTFIRQNALAVILAQMGSFVPAGEARIGLVDRVFTRIGSGDEISRGRSTFLVEMEETANILNNATGSSFVVLDEVGRGTSTYDGVAIAWALTEHLHDSVRARTLFATHYHELTELARELPGVVNANVEVREWNDEVLFLHKIVPGACDRSYGIHVGRLAGLPAAVVERSRAILHELETGQWGGTISRGRKRPRMDGEAPKKEFQLDLFAVERKDVLEALRALDLHSMTPIEALVRLQEIQQKLR
ncbi:MAG: DNA mismatch repair protein MutS [Planctomycetes bacterium]|nr:DNA mismatch repair protein MutS [Planctomycetota bacterium]